MKMETAKLSRQKGTSVCDERGPLFPPLHVSETGLKAGVRAPPRNKMALFEQFTVPLNRHAFSHEATPSCSFTVQRHGNECHLTYLPYAEPHTLVSSDSISNHEAGMNVKSSLTIGSFSSGSAVVNMNEPQRVQMQEPADVAFPPGMAHEQGQRLDEVSEDKSKDKSHVEDMPASGHPPDSLRENLHNCDLSSVCGNGNAENSACMGGPHQEAAVNCEGLASAAGSHFSGTENGSNSYTHEQNATKIVESIQLNSKAPSSELYHLMGNSVNPLQRPKALSQDGFAFMVNVAYTKTPSASSQEKAASAAVISFPDSIKPKDVINAVGQRLFWKARKAILRQQEVFSNQVFELHKLTKVQKLLAKIPNMLIDEHMLLSRGSDKVSGDHIPNEGISDEQHESLDNRKAGRPAAQQSGGSQRPHVSKQEQQKFVARESQDVKAQTNASFSLAFPSTPFGQPCHSLSFDGVSAWGYPMGPLNRPFLYSPSGSYSVPSGTPFGGAFVVGVNPPMAAPLAFPCYGGRPEQTMPPCPNNQWPPATMYHNPYLVPMVNDWFATMNYQGRAPLVSDSDKAGPTSSAPSINTRPEASAHSIQPAAVPSVWQHLGSSRLMGTNARGCAAAGASVSTPVGVLSRKASAGEQRRGSSPVTGSGRITAEGRGQYEGERKAEADSSARSGKVKGCGGQLPTICGMMADGREIAHTLGGSALNLFPLQPSPHSRGQGEGRMSRNTDGQGRVIKAVPHSALAASESAAGILLFIQKERQL